MAKKTIKNTLITSTGISIILLSSVSTSALASITAHPIKRYDQATYLIDKSQTNTEMSDTFSNNPQQLSAERPSTKDSEIQSSTSSSDSEIASQPDTIVVTGSHIRGVTAPIGSNLITINRADIEREGYTTTRDLTEKLIQNFGGGATGERQGNQASGYNLGFGSTVNLRGLGSLATLVLVNGRRIPTTGYDGSVPDISTIPVSVIERVEILPDGASAVYGSDAVAGVVNFVLRKRYTGIETQARYGLATEAPLDEFQVNQTAGTAWKNGSLFISYQYNRRDRLRMSDRPFTASADLRKYGGMDYRSVHGSPGNIVDPLTLRIFAVIPPAQNGLALTPAELLPPTSAALTDPNTFQDTFPKQLMHSIYGHIRQSLTENTEIYIDSRFSNRRFDSSIGPQLAILRITPSNPYYIDIYGDRSDVHVAYSFINDLEQSKYKGNVKSFSSAIGVVLENSTNWTTDFFTSYSQDHSVTRQITLNFSRLNSLLTNTNPDTAFNPFGDGLDNDPELMRSLIRNGRLSVKATSLQANLVSSGQIATIFENSVRTAIGGDFREQKLRREDRPSTEGEANIRRRVGAIFGEVHLPFITHLNQFGWIHSFALSISARHERYWDSSTKPQRLKRSEQQSTDFRAGFLFDIMSTLRLIGSYGTSFRAPNLNALSQLTYVSTASFPDPNSPTGSIYGMQVQGAEKNLKNETAKTWTAGFEFSHPQISTIKINFNYFNIKFKNQVDRLPQLTNAINDPAFSDFIIRNPSLGDLSSFCGLASPDNLFVSLGDCTTPGIVQVIYDGRIRNLSKTNVDGLDAKISYNADVSKIGNLSASVATTYLFNFDQTISPAAAPIERLNTPDYPVALRSRGALIFETASGLVASVDVNYTDNYYDRLRKRKIESWTTFDFSLSYKFNRDHRIAFLRNSEAQINIRNVFNNDPPFYENANLKTGYDPANSEAIGRLLYFSISKKW